MSTVTVLKKLAPYSIHSSYDPRDSAIHSFLKQYKPSLLTSIQAYSRSLYSEEQHYQSFRQYDRPLATERLISHNINANTTLERARALAEASLCDAFSIEATPMSNLDVVPWISTSSAGYGYHGLKRDNYRLARGRATSNLVHFNAEPHTFKSTPWKAFARTQLALRENPKIRHVWGAPFHHILIEGTIAAPIINNLTIHDTPIYIGRNLFKDLPLDIADLATDHYIYCLDISRFDASVNTQFIKWFFKFLRRCVSFPDHFTSTALDYIEHVFHHIPILMPDGVLYECTTGVPSGSYFTQMLDSYVNLTLMFYVQLCLFGSTQPTKVLGDDSIFTAPHRFEVSLISDLLSPFNMTINEDKSIITSSIGDVLFLGHNFYGSSVSREDFTLACLAYYQERDSKTLLETYERVQSLYLDCGTNSFFMLNLLLYIEKILDPLSLIHI